MYVHTFLVMRFQKSFPNLYILYLIASVLDALFRNRFGGMGSEKPP